MHDETKRESVFVCFAERKATGRQTKIPKKEEQSGVKEKKVIKSAQIAYITFTQRLTDRVRDTDVPHPYLCLYTSRHPAGGSQSQILQHRGESQ